MERRLFNCNSLSELLTMYFGLGEKEKLSIFTEEITVTEGTEFFRARALKSFATPNYSEPSEWGPVPVKFARQGRFNEKGESVLYVASDPDFLEREIRLRVGDEYCLAKYVCIKPFKVGTLFGYNNLVNGLLFRIAMSVAGADDLTSAENKLIDEYYLGVKDGTLSELTINLLSPLYIHKLLPNLYDATNKLGKLIKRKYDCGFRYSSVYFPIEMSGGPQVLTFNGVKYGNYVLTPKACENIELVSVEKRICSKIQDLEVLIKEFAKA